MKIKSTTTTTLNPSTTVPALATTDSSVEAPTLDSIESTTENSADHTINDDVLPTNTALPSGSRIKSFSNNKVNLKSNNTTKVKSKTNTNNSKENLSTDGFKSNSLVNNTPKDNVSSSNSKINTSNKSTNSKNNVSNNTKSNVSINTKSNVSSNTKSNSNNLLDKNTSKLDLTAVDNTKKNIAVQKDRVSPPASGSNAIVKTPNESRPAPKTDKTEISNTNIQAKEKVNTDSNLVNINGSQNMTPNIPADITNPPINPPPSVVNNTPISSIFSIPTPTDQLRVAGASNTAVSGEITTGGNGSNVDRNNSSNGENAEVRNDINNLTENNNNNDSNHNFSGSQRNKVNASPPSSNEQNSVNQGVFVPSDSNGSSFNPNTSTFEKLPKHNNQKLISNYSIIFVIILLILLICFFLIFLKKKFVMTSKNTSDKHNNKKFRKEILKNYNKNIMEEIKEVQQQQKNLTNNETHLQKPSMILERHPTKKESIFSNEYSDSSSELGDNFFAFSTKSQSLYSHDSSKNTDNNSVDSEFNE
ncbi:hypothetical protein HDU92_000671 [Lobulomyces angularis]|nr:hypothetical protein HDU92_000671 [Lobulomyces angularis]